MRLSEAMRLGAKVCPQAFGFTEDRDGGRCALGAAFHTEFGNADWVTKVVGGRLSSTQNERWPVLAVMAEPPCPCRSTIQVEWAVAHLNNDHKWSREAIAEWVEVVEGQLEAKAQKALAPLMAEPARSKVEAKVLS